MTTTAAKNLAGQVAEKPGHPADNKAVEKRRALGRGLESLLPGPRVVAPALPVVAPGNAASDTATPDRLQSEAGRRTGVSAPHGHGSDAGDSVGAIQGVVGDAAAKEFPLPAKEAGSGAPRYEVDSTAVLTAELRSAWTGESPVPTQSSVPAQSPVPTQSIPTAPEPITIQAQAEGRAPSNLVVNIPLDHIDRNPYQTRYLFDEEMLKELAASIQANGVVQPVVVRPTEHGRYLLILGERRCRASKMAGKISIPAIVRRVSDQQAAEMTIVENLQREDLNCMEQAEAFRVLSQEFNLTQQQIGDRVGMSRESVSNYMRLLKLPESVMEYLATDKLTFSDAREIMVLDDPKLIAKAADVAVNKHLSIEKIEDLVMELQGLVERPGPNRHGARWVDPNVKAAQSELERLLGLRVRIRDRRGRGKIVIEYATVDDYERVVEALKRK